MHWLDNDMKILYDSKLLWVGCFSGNLSKMLDISVDWENWTFYSFIFSNLNVHTLYSKFLHSQTINSV